jgi:hypothetical protein
MTHLPGMNHPKVKALIKKALRSKKASLQFLIDVGAVNKQRAKS